MLSLDHKIYIFSFESLFFFILNVKIFYWFKKIIFDLDLLKNKLS